MRLIDCFADTLAYVGWLDSPELPELAEAPVEVVRGDLETLLSRDAGRWSGDEQAFEQARFAVCAWVDERILTSGWSGARSWMTEPLQKKLFGTLRAGEEFFDRLSLLLGEDEGGEAASGSLRLQILEVYAACLALGFQGKFYHGDDSERLARVRKLCLRALYGPQGAPALEPPAQPAPRGRRGDGVGAATTILAFVTPALALGVLYLLYDGMLTLMLRNLLAGY